MNEEKIITELIDEEKIGLSITDIVRLTNLSRSAVRTNLARLEGANKIKARKIGMAKVYILNPEIMKTTPRIESTREQNSISNTINH